MVLLQALFFFLILQDSSFDCINNSIMKKIFTIVVLPLIILVLGFFIIRSLTAPIKFQKEREHRQHLAIDRLKDIRVLQTSYKTEYGEYTDSFDTLEQFYNEGYITIIRQIGLV